MASLYDRISDGTISIDEITASMERSTSAGGKYFQSMEKQSKTLNGQISTLKDNFSMFAGVLAEDTTNAISNEFLPAINNAIQEMQEAFSEEGFEGMAEAFAEGFSNILLMLVEKAPEVVNVALIMINSFVNSIQENLPKISNSAIEIITVFANGMLRMMPTILQLGVDLIANLILGISEQAPVLIPQIVETILQLFLILTSNENLSKLTDAGVQLLIALIEGIINSIPELLENSDATLQVLLNVFSGGQYLIRKIGINLIISLIKGLAEAVPNMLKSSGKYVDRLIESFGKGVEKIKDVGKNLVQGLWNGINSAKDWIIDKIGGFTDSVVNAFKDFFGIHSPSRLMKDEVGKFVAQGVGVGFEDELSNVYKDMEKAINLETEKMSASVQTGNVYNKVMNTTPVQVNGTYTSTLEVNGEVLAEVVNDVNNKKDLQYMF